MVAKIALVGRSSKGGAWETLRACEDPALFKEVITAWKTQVAGQKARFHAASLYQGVLEFYVAPQEISHFRRPRNIIALASAFGLVE